MALTQRKKILYAIIAIALLLIVAAMVFFHFFLPQIITRAVHEKLHEQFNPTPPGLYAIKLAEVSLHISPAVIFFPSITIKPAWNESDSVMPENLPKSIIEVQADSLQLSLSGLISLARGKQDIRFSKIHLSHLNVKIVNNPASHDTIPERDENGFTGNISCDDFSIAHAFVTYAVLSDTLHEVFRTENIRVGGKISMEQKEQSKQAWVDLSGISLNTDSLSYTPNNSLYTYHCHSISFDGTSAGLTARNLQIAPLYDKREFQNHISHQTDIMDVLLKSVQLTGFDINELINDKTFICNQISIDEAEIEAYRDRNLPLDTQRRPIMPTLLILNAPLLIDIATVKLDNAIIVYSERPENGNTNGHVDFQQLSATLQNITNIPEKLQSDSIMTIEARAQLFGSGLLKANFAYNLMDSGGGFTARGELGNMNFTAINTAVFPLTGIKIDAGRHQHSVFRFSGNDIRAAGTLEMRYQGLAVELEPDRSKLRRNVVGWLGRNLVYQTDNPAGNNQLRTGTIEFDRDITRFVFHYWWQSYLSGIKHSVLRDSASRIID